MSDFSERMYTQELTREFLTHATDKPLPVIKKRVEDVPERIERSYAAVAMVEQKEESRHHDEPAYTLRVIRKEGAEDAEIRRALAEVTHWIIKDD